MEKKLVKLSDVESVIWSFVEPLHEGGCLTQNAYDEVESAVRRALEKLNLKKYQARMQKKKLG